MQLGCSGVIISLVHLQKCDSYMAAELLVSCSCTVKRRLDSAFGTAIVVVAWQSM